jgi:hypothetical protein
MMIGLAMLGWLALLFPTLFHAGMSVSFAAVRGLVAR